MSVDAGSAAARDFRLRLLTRFPDLPGCAPNGSDLGKQRYMAGDCGILRGIPCARRVPCLALVVLAYLYPPGRTPHDRWWVRWEAAKVIRRARVAANA